MMADTVVGMQKEYLCLVLVLSVTVISGSQNGMYNNDEVVGNISTSL